MSESVPAKGACEPRTRAQRLGDAAEDLVISRLSAVGWAILARNLHVGRAEIDIVALDPGPPPVVVFVEVRWRGRRDFGLAEETIDWRKRARLHRAAWEWLGTPAARSLGGLAVRFDLVVVEPPAAGAAHRVRHHRGAV